MSAIEPTLTIDNHLGRVEVYRKAYPDSLFQQLKNALEWKRNSMHGNHDRMVWDGLKVNQQDKPNIINLIGDKICTALGVDNIGSESFANYYQGNQNRTFWHRDADINPNETVVMVTFGESRVLTFTDYRTDETYPIDLGDRDIVVFDYNWNLNTFHAVERTIAVAGERISLQFFNARDEKKWTKDQLKEWFDTEPIKKQGVFRRREKVKRLLKKRTFDADGLEVITKKKQKVLH